MIVTHLVSMTHIKFDQFNFNPFSLVCVLNVSSKLYQYVCWTSVYVTDGFWLVGDSVLKTLLDCTQCRNISIEHNIYSFTRTDINTPFKQCFLYSLPIQLFI
jgi:hypothetical protein